MLNAFRDIVINMFLFDIIIRIIFGVHALQLALEKISCII